MRPATSRRRRRCTSGEPAGPGDRVGDRAAAAGSPPHRVLPTLVMAPGGNIATVTLLPTLPGVIVGIPLGVYLYRAATQHQLVTVPPLWQLVTVLLGTMLAVGALTAVPARLGARRSPAEVLQSEHA